MTHAERQLVLEEIHGVASSAVPESPAFVTQKLKALRQLLQSIRKKSAYERASFLCPKYVNSPEFQLMFLRAELFNVRKAAKRIIQFFEQKLQLWGDRKIARRITSADLTEDDLSAHESEAFQIINADRAGRPIMFLSLKDAASNGHGPSSRNNNHKLRAQWYQMMRAVESSERAQKNGLVKVVWNLTPNVSPRSSPPASVFKGATSSQEVAYSRAKKNLGDETNHENEEEEQQLQQIPKRVSYNHHIHSIPVRIIALHYCVREESSQGSRRGTQPSLSRSTAASYYDPSFVLGNDNICRFRSHVGSPLECKKQLDTFGIPRILLPIDPGRSGRTQRGNESLEKQATGERQFKSSSRPDTITVNKGGQSQGDDVASSSLIGNKEQEIRASEEDEDGRIWLPRPYDVIMGRGRPYQEYDGNKQMNQLIEDELNRCQAGKIRDCVWNILKSKGVRFLQRSEVDPEEWIEVADTIGRGKVYFAVRIQVRKRQRQQQEEEEKDNSTSTAPAPKRRKVQ